MGKTAIAKVQTDNGSPQSMLALIERLAFNPEANIEVVERLLAIQTEVMERQAKIDFEVAMTSMQPELPIIEKLGEVVDGKSGKLRYRYARWEDVNEKIKPYLAKYGFALTFSTDTFRDGSEYWVRVVALITHVSGYQRTSTMEVPADASGNKNAPQAIGSAVQYGKRYTAFALLNLQTNESEDDDAVEAGFRRIDAEQVAALRKALKETNSDEEAFCKRFRIDGLEEMPVNKYELAHAHIEIKRLKNGGAQ